jgi:hypothetical protein
MTLPVLIIAFKRHENLRKILEICKANNVPSIYISIDGPIKKEQLHLDVQKSMIDIAKNFANNNAQIKMNLREIDSNVGCAVSVLSACDWIFRNENSAIILEDDCIPSSDFFEFASSSIPLISSDEKIWLSCGSQFAPLETTLDQWFLSRYALIWGWATTKAKWQQILDSIYEGNFKYNKQLSLKENLYWKAGSTRAQLGHVDVWDTILVQQMISNNRYAILPKNNLVTNIGNDVHATHTHQDSGQLNLSSGSFHEPLGFPKNQILIDNWLRNNVYHIKRRHVCSTRITAFRDSILNRFRPRITLSERLKKFT